jgi:hypothetical protein
MGYYTSMYLEEENMTSSIFTEQYGRFRELLIQKKYTEEEQSALVSSLIPVTWIPQAPFYTDLKKLLDEMLEAGEGSDPSELGLE